MNPRLDLYAEDPAWWQKGLARAYGLGVRGRLALFRQGLLRSRKLPARVISVGNLVAGGTGKTPAAIMIARLLRERGRKVAVLSRGYGGRKRPGVTVVSDGERVLVPAGKCGDEPALMAQKLPGVPVLVGADRYDSGIHALKQFDSEILILDDGFQHLRLHRDLNLLLLDAEKPWGNGCLLPAGALREPEGEAVRAHAFLLTRASSADPALAETLGAGFPDRPVFAARHRPVHLVSLDGGERQPCDMLAGKKVLAFCGLARPETLADTLSSLGVEVPLLVPWPDHYQPRVTDLDRLAARAQSLNIDTLVTTAKDAVKLAGLSWGPGEGPGRLPGLKVWVLEVEMELWSKQELFIRLLEGP